MSSSIEEIQATQQWRLIIDHGDLHVDETHLLLREAIAAERDYARQLDIGIRALSEASITCEPRTRA